MSDLLDLLPYLWFGIASLAALILTVYDKIAARHFPDHRVPEKTLFIVSLLGGSIMMYTVMQIIRHKTKHKRFMIGIPLIIIAQLLLIGIILVK